MTVLDPSGFQISARVRTAGDDSKIFNLWIGGGTGRFADGKATNESFFRGERRYEDLPIVSSVEMEIGLGLAGKVSIGINTTYDMGLALLESQLFTIGNVGEVQIGYPRIGLFTPWFGGIMAKPSIRLGPDEGLVATLNVEGAAFSALRSVSNRQFRGKSYLQMAQEIADLHGWELRTVPHDLATLTDDPMNIERNISQGNMTDWRFIQSITRSGQCDAFIQPDRKVAGATALVIRKRSENPQPRLTLNARGDANFVDVFPLFTFESSAEGVWLPQGSGTIRCNDVDPDSRDEGEVEVGPTTTSTPRTADAVVAEGGVQEGNTRVEMRAESTTERLGERLLCSPRDPRTPLEQLQSHSDEQQARGGINATTATVGLPQLFPGDFITIINMGIFSGNYGIQSLTHRGEPGMFSTSLTLLSNAIFAEQLASFLQDEPQVINDQEPEEATDAGGGGSTEVESEAGADS